MEVINLNGRVWHTVLVAIRTSEVEILAIGLTAVGKPPVDVVLVEVEHVLVECHTFSEVSLDVCDEFLDRIQHIGRSIGIVALVSKWLDAVVVDIAKQGVPDTSTCIEIAGRLTLLWLHVDTTHTALVLFVLSLLEEVEQTELNHRPLDRVRTFLVEVSDILALNLLHRAELHLDHGVIYVPHLVLELHATLVDLTWLVALRYLVEEGIEENVTVLHTIANREVFGKVAKLQDACNKSILTENDELIAQSGIIHTAIVGSELARSKRLHVTKLIAALVILVALLKEIWRTP